MALIQIIKYEAEDDNMFVWKYPSDQIRLGAQLIVNEGQKAIFVKGGQALDIFEPGTFTLTTGNIPLIDKLINLPFGGDTPFAAEIWYINTTVKRDLTWGTPSPIPLMDSNLGFPVSARSFGKWGARIVDVRSFVTQIVGSQSFADATKINDYFIGEIIQSLTSNLSNAITSGQTSILQISTFLTPLSKSSADLIKMEFDKFGVELVNFNIESINIPTDELKRIQDVFAKTLEAKELSKVNVGAGFSAIKSFEVLNNAAENPSEGSIGGMLGAGIGLGAGFPLGQQMGQNLTTSQNAEESSTDKLRELKKMLDENLISEEQYNLKRDKIIEEM
jgi:membrane protease subunit (stomatin/prohibitin family)